MRYFRHARAGALTGLISAAVLLLVLFISFAARAAEIRGGEEALAALQAEIARLAEPAEGVVGIGIKHLGTGAEVYLNGDEFFPMASTYKLAMAVTLLQDVEAGRKSLDDRIELKSEDLVVSSALTGRLRYANSAIALRNLLEIMIVISDNTATDLIFEADGGGKRITEHVRALGIEDMRIDRNTADLIRDYLGWNNPPPGEKLSLFHQIEALSDEEREAAMQPPAQELIDAFNADMRDVSTPAAMVALLDAIWTGRALDPEMTDWLKGVMGRTETGAHRLAGLLPAETPLAHKTGTIGETTNDVGVITLPHDRGELIVVAFVKEAKADIPARERVIAEIARAAHDFFTFNVVE